MTRINLELQFKQDPQIIQSAVAELNKLGYQVDIIKPTELRFMHKGCICFYYPYSGWHTGQSIKDGQGLNNLLKQLKNVK